MTRMKVFERRRRPQIPYWLGACLLGAIAVFLLWETHSSHILGSLPWLLVLACPVIHLVMHSDHGHGRSGSGGSERCEHSDRHEGNRA